MMKKKKYRNFDETTRAVISKKNIAKQRIHAVKYSVTNVDFEDEI